MRVAKSRSRSLEAHARLSQLFKTSAVLFADRHMMISPSPIGFGAGR